FGTRGLSYVSVKTIPCKCGIDVTGTDCEVAEAFSLVALFRIMEQDRLAGSNDTLLVHILSHKLVETRSIERGATIEIVEAGIAAHESDFSEVGPRAAIGTAGHADDDFVVFKTRPIEDVLQCRDELWQETLALSKCQTACWQRHTCHTVS